MVPDSNDGSDERPTASDGGADLGFDPDALYRVVHAAVKDALLDVIGTVLLLGVALVLVATGGQLLLWSLSGAAAVAGAVLIVLGCYVAATALDLLPPIGDWL